MSYLPPAQFTLESSFPRSSNRKVKKSAFSTPIKTAPFFIIINRPPLCLATLLHISACLDRHLIMKILYFFCYAYIPAQLRQKLAPRANRCFLKGACLGSERLSMFWSFFSFSTARHLTFHEHEFFYSLPLILVGAYWISIFWIFFTSGFSCASRASGGVRVPRESGSQPSIEQPALALRSSNNKEQPASLSSSSNNQLPTDYPSSFIAAEPSPAIYEPGPEPSYLIPSNEDLGNPSSQKKADNLNPLWRPRMYWFHHWL